MRRSFLPSAVALVAGLLLLAGCGGAGEPHDLLILGGTVVDGTGEPGQRADVGVRGGRVTFVGDAGDAVARDTLDARGLTVAPGFVDAHSHTAPAIADSARRFNEGFLRQGVTTVMGGPDGGMGPWDIRELVAAYERHGVGTNVAFYVGHNAVRDSVLGDDQQRAPTADEMEAMKAMVREGMELGARGLSTGLMYEPGMYSETSEVVELARVVAPFGGVYDSHVRDPVHDFVASHREVIRIAEAAGIPGKLGHLKGVGLHNEGVIRQVVDLVEEARVRGVEIVSDQYPYDGAATASLAAVVVVPHELEELRELYGAAARAGEDDPARERYLAALADALRDPGRRAALKEASENGVDGGFAWLKATGYDAMRVVSSPDDPALEGRYLSAMAEARGGDPFDVVAGLILDADEPVRITLGAITEDDVRALMVQRWNMIASDGAWTDGSDRPGGHPRSAGTFPRFLGHYVRDEGLMNLEEGVRRITSLPADFHGMEDRGRLAEGKAGDVTVFDAATIIDRSDWSHPRRWAQGVHHVVVNGVVTLRDGEITGETGGRFLPGGVGRPGGRPSAGAGLLHQVLGHGHRHHPTPGADLALCRERLVDDHLPVADLGDRAPDHQLRAQGRGLHVVHLEPGRDVAGRGAVAHLLLLAPEGGRRGAPGPVAVQERRHQTPVDVARNRRVVRLRGEARDGPIALPPGLEPEPLGVVAAAAVAESGVGGVVVLDGFAGHGHLRVGATSSSPGRRSGGSP